MYELGLFGIVSAKVSCLTLDPLDQLRCMYSYQSPCIGAV